MGCWGKKNNTEREPEKLLADNKIRRVLFCSGKVYYDLVKHREEISVDVKKKKDCLLLLD